MLDLVVQATQRIPFQPRLVVLYEGLCNFRHRQITVGPINPDAHRILGRNSRMSFNSRLTTSMIVTVLYCVLEKNLDPAFGMPLQGGFTRRATHALL